jgi:hypothetical protein
VLWLAAKRQLKKVASSGFTVKKHSRVRRGFVQTISSFDLSGLDWPQLAAEHVLPLPEVRHSRMHLAGIQGMFGLDPR